MFLYNLGFVEPIKGITYDLAEFVTTILLQSLVKSFRNFKDYYIKRSIQPLRLCNIIFWVSPCDYNLNYNWNLKAVSFNLYYQEVYSLLKKSPAEQNSVIQSIWWYVSWVSWAQLREKSTTWKMWEEIGGNGSILISIFSV